MLCKRHGSSLVQLSFDDSTWRAISNLLQRSWFKRLWAVQEAYLALSLVRCGSARLDHLPLRFPRSLVQQGSIMEPASSEVIGNLVELLLTNTQFQTYSTKLPYYFIDGFLNLKVR